jgi:hypothetical protein
MTIISPEVFQSTASEGFNFRAFMLAKNSQIFTIARVPGKFQCQVDSAKRRNPNVFLIALGCSKPL